MSSDFVTTTLILCSFVLTFLVSRTLSRKFRERRRQKEEAARRATESRQVRRARERAQRAR